MLERADGSEMCISVMTVILKSLGVGSAGGEVSELFCRDRYSCRHGLSDRLDERQRGPAEVACGGAAQENNRREASAASDADMVDKEWKEGRRRLVLQCVRRSAT